MSLTQQEVLNIAISRLERIRDYSSRLANGTIIEITPLSEVIELLQGILEKR